MKTKNIKLAVLSFVGLLGLTACGSSVVAKPTDYNAPQIEISNFDKTVYNNVMSVIYDAIQKGGVGGDVLNQILREFAISAFGDYDTLKDAAIGNGTTINAFVASHKAYWTTDSDGNRITDTGEKVADPTNPATNASESEKERVEGKYLTIEKRIATTMYDKISGGSYSERNYFSEAEFLRSLRTSLKKVADPNADGAKLHAPQLLLPSIKPEEVFDDELGFLYRENFQSETNTYIKDEVLPDIYKTLLTEQYIFDQNYSTLGRSYARKVNIIEIPNNSENPFAAKYLADSLINEICDGKIAKLEKNSDDDALLDRFQVYDRAYIGAIKADSDEDKLLLGTDGKGSPDLVNEFKYKDTVGGYKAFSSTNFGDLITKYEKISTDPKLNDSVIESEFTNNNAYTKEQGLEIKANDLRLKSNVTNGWFIKNGGLTNLPEDIRNRLFNISVANGVKEVGSELFDRFYQADGELTPSYHNPSEDENGYIAVINGRNYLKKSSRTDDNTRNDILHYDSNTKSYYIIEIQEAVSSTKMSKSTSSTSSYYKLRPDDVEEIINNVSEQVGNNDTYTSEATEYYLKLMDIIFHDDDVHTYFTTNYSNSVK